MEMKFSHSLIGYDPKVVQENIECLKREFENTLGQLNNQLSRTNEEIYMLQREISKMELETADYKKINEEIMQILFAAHMEASEEVYNTSKRAEQIGIETREIVLKREREYAELNKTMQRLTDEMQSIARGYNLALEAFGDG